MFIITGSTLIEAVDLTWLFKN